MTEASAPQGRYPWTRRVHAQKCPPGFDRWGWVDEASWVRAGAPLADRREDAVVVVLGERGCGKSDLLAQEAAALVAEGLPAVLVDLSKRGQFYDANSARDLLSGVLKLAAAEQPKYVLLDSLDEGLDRLGNLDELLLHCLQNLDREQQDRLRLRIACRSGRWPRDLEEDLGSLWGYGVVSVVGVTPLSRSDVKAAAACTGVVGGAFTHRLQQAGLVALAQSPITLQPLLDAEAEGEDLPATMAEAYQHACRRLCSHGHRDAHPMSPDHLLALAGRVAAVLQYGHYEAVCDSPDIPEIDIPLTDLDGGAAPGPTGTTHHCGMLELLALMDSGLMVGVGPQRWAFAHDSYQEYLAAQFLTWHDLRKDAQRQLLWIGDGTAGHVVERHREVAAWRVMDDGELFTEVLRDDPEMLLLADLPSLPEERRQQVVARLLALVQDDDTVRLDRWRLHRLNHPGLTEQLLPHLHPDTQDSLLYAALGIARASNLPGLSGALLAVAEAPAVDADLRRLAVQALGRELDADQVARLKRLAEESDPNLVAAALGRLWPEHLDLPAFLDLVPSPDPFRVGAAFILFEEIPTRLGRGDIDDAVAWAARTLGSRHPRAGLTLAGDRTLSVRLPVWILAQVVTLLGQEGSGTDPTQRDRRLREVATALLALAARGDFHELDLPVQALGEALAAHKEIRRELGRQILERGDDRQVDNLLSHPGSPALFTTDEPTYWVLQWPHLSVGARQRARWLVSAWPDPTDPDLPRAQELRAHDPELKAATSRWDTQAQDEAKQSREREEQRRRLVFDEAGVREVLTRIGAGEPAEHWWVAIRGELYHTADGTVAAPDRWLGAVAAAPSFPSEDSELHRLLMDAAVAVVQGGHVITSGVTDPASTNWNQITALTALALLDPARLAEALNHDPRRAAAATVALAANDYYEPDDITLQHTLLSRCAHLAGQNLPVLLAEALDGCNEAMLTSLARNLAETGLATAVDILRGWAQDPQRGDPQWAAVMTTLARAGDQQVQDDLRTALEDPAVQQAAHQPGARWIRAATAMMACPQLPEVWPTITTVLAQPGVLAALLERIIVTPGESWPAKTAKLPEAVLAELYAMVTDHIGVSRLKESGRGVIETDPPRELHNDLLHLLISKGSAEAARQLAALAARFPDLAYLRWQARAVAYTAADRRALPVTPDNLRRLAADAQLRVVADERHLLDTVLASLDNLQTVLQGPNGLSIALWNRATGKVNHTDWWPCWEEDFSDLVAVFLRQDIGGHRVIINREVQIQRPGLSGKRTDIHIQATAPPGSGHQPLTVTIECKGCWNDELPTALADQLVKDYLRAPRTAGILLIGYFDCDRWNPEEKRRRGHAAHDHSIESLQREQDARAQEQRDQHGAIVTATILDCRLPGTDNPWRAESHLSPQ